MPRSLPVGLAEVLKSGYAESHSTLELSLPSDIAPAITYYFATARLTIDGVIYDRQLRDTGAVKTSLTRAADRVTVELQNVDTILGVDLLAVADTLYGANVRFGRYWKDLRSAATFHHILLTGAVAGVEVNENVVRLTLISDTYAAVSVGAKEQVIRTCRFQVQGEFRGTNCGYSGAKLTCNGLIDDTDGCEGRHGSPLKRAKFGGFVYIEGQNTIAGAAALPVPAYNQLMKLAASDGTVSATSKQQPFLALHEDGFSVTNDNTNEQTRVTPKFNVQAINVKLDYNATGDGVTSDGTAINNAVTAALAQGRPLYFPAGTYLGANLTGLTYQIKIFGDGRERTILKASASNTPVIEISNASSHTISIEDLTVEGAGTGTGTSGHGIYIHGQTDGIYNLTLRNLFIKNCGGNGVKIDGQFTNRFESVFVSNCSENLWDISGGNTVAFDSCYADDVANNKCAYRVRAGQVKFLNCNGLDSLGSVSDWAILGQAIADGDPADSYCEAVLDNCNVEAFKRYGVWAKVGSRVSAYATIFTTSASGSAHVAIKTDFTNNQPGIIDSSCRFNVQGTGTWANGYAIHTNSDIPVLALGRTDITEFYSDAAATARVMPLIGAEPISTVPYVKIPNLSSDEVRLREQAAPPSSSANTIPLYAKAKGSTNALYLKKDSGAEIELGGFPSGIFNAVTEYNANPDGVTNTTTQVQAAIDAAELAGGGTVFLQAGTYKVTGLTVSGRVKLCGSSDGETVIYSTTNAKIIDITSASFEMPALENLRIRGDVTAGSAQHGIYVDDGTGTGGLRTLIRNVWIENCGGAGLKIERAFSSIFEGIYATNCAGYPFDYDAANMPSNLFVSCYAGLLRDSAPAGFRIRAGEAVLKSCNGVNSLNPGSKWAVVGKKNGVDGDTTNTGAILDLQDCNLESWIEGGILAYHASLVNIRGNTTFVGQLLTTQLNGAINNSVTTLTVDSTQYFSTAGTVAIDSEHITYTGKTATTLTGCTRGAHGTSAASHSDNATVKFLKKPIEIEHINEGTDYFAHALQRGVIEDSVVFKDGGLSNYVRGAAIHANGLATFQTAGRGSRIVGDNPLQHYWNSVTSTATKLSRADSYLSKLAITSTTSLTQPTVRYIEVNHSGATTLTLPNPGLYQVGEYVTVKDVSSGGASVNNITLQANGGGTVNGSSFTMNIDKQSVILVPDGSSDWRIVATYSPGGSGITGSGSANRLAVWSGTSSQTSVSGLEYDAGSSVLKSPARFWGANTSASAPTFGFTSDTGTGLYLSATGKMGFASSAANAGAGGNVLTFQSNGLLLGGNRVTWDASETIFDLTGSGSPEGAVTAAIGSVYRRTNGGSTTTLYVKESGTGNTGWVAVGGLSGANAALSNLASVAINTTLVSDTNNTDDLGTNSIAWRDLYLAGTFNLLARSDPGSPTNSDLWRSSSRNAISIRNSGQTEDLSGSMWRSSASVFFDTTTTETSIISDTGVGTKTLAADRLKAGSHIRIKASGFYGTKATSPGTFTIKLKNGATTMLTIAAFTLPTNVADQNWWIEATGALNATGSSGTINWTITFHYNDGTGDLKTRTYTVNSTTINTTTANALNITGQFSVSDAANFWQTYAACIEIF